MKFITAQVDPVQDGAETWPWSDTMQSSNRGEPIEILLVEDSPDDAALTVDALRSGRVHNRISVVDDGVEAMAFLRRQGIHTQAARPDLILLDLNLPRKSGREVLAEIKQDPDLRRIPVVIMTSSDDEKDILAAYNLYVNCYITKPVDLDQFISVVKTIEHFWFSVVKLPAA
ncbi:MAG TPA: response regulator [Tepidisphaeraceae bacterium]|jgi:CheY-like chemotaxis protein|nr:response regulator [Tepidisphaeraceae bacterium]